MEGCGHPEPTVKAVVDIPEGVASAEGPTPGVDSSPLSPPKWADHLLKTYREPIHYDSE